jgi:hypothetical protein
MPLPWVQSPSQARRLAKRKMSRLTAELRGDVTMNLYGLVGLGERYLRLRITENPALTDLIVEVSNVQIDLAALQVTYSWVTANPDIDAWNRFSEEGPASPTPTVPDVAPLTPPTINTVTPQYDPSASSDVGARLNVNITAPVTADVQWLIRWRRSGESPPNNWTEAKATDVDDGALVDLLSGFVPASGTLDVQVAYVTAGGTSPWSVTQTIAVSAPTGTFTGAVGGVFVAGTGVTITDNHDGTFIIDSSGAGASASITASEALTAGDLVNLHTVTGAIRMRLADSTGTTKPAHGFVTASVLSGAAGTFLGPGQVNDALSGLTPGATYWLSTSGDVVSAAPATSAHGDQEVGQALSATELLFMPKMMVEAP